jgi:Cysteine-rich CPCC
MPFTNIIKERAADGSLYRCPCCGHRTLDERGVEDICQVCYWEDDGQDDHDADEVRGGPNYELSLTQARQNFREFGACSRRVLPHVRMPKPDEL